MIPSIILAKHKFGTGSESEGHSDLNGIEPGQNWYRLKPKLADGRERLSNSSDWLIVASWYMFALSGLRSSPVMNGVPNPVLTKHTCMYMLKLLMMSN